VGNEQVCHKAVTKNMMVCMLYLNFIKDFLLQTSVLSQYTV